MELETILAGDLMRRHPARAASVLERLPLPEAARVLGEAPAACAASLLERLSPQHAAGAMASLSDAHLADLLETLPVSTASRLVRRLESERAESILGELPGKHANGIRTLVRFPETSAGALLDPHVLALPDDFTAGEALTRVREAADEARYNLYVVDDAQKLVGVLNLRELFLSPPETPLVNLMVRRPVALRAAMDRTDVVAHSGWREVHALPVVDDEGVYLGAVRYRTLRALEDQLFRGNHRDAEAHDALGELFFAGASGLLDAFAMPSRKRSS